MSPSRVVVLLERLQDRAFGELERMSDEGLRRQAVREGHNLEAEAAVLRECVAEALSSEARRVAAPAEVLHGGAEESAGGREELDGDIAELNLARVGFRATVSEGWSQEKVEAVELEYRCLLQCLRDFPEDTIEPSRDCDRFWCCHFQCEDLYRQQITQILGRYLDRPKNSRVRPTVVRPGAARALVIATSRYDDPRLSALHSSSADAAGLQQVLADPQIGNYTVALCQDESYTSWRAQIENFFATASQDEQLLLYISGHAVKDTAGELYFLAKDTRLDLLDTTGIPASFVQQHSERSAARGVLMLLDTCFSGAYGAGTGTEELVHTGKYLTGGAGTVVIAASDAMQHALAADTLDRSARPSLFSRYVIDGMITGEADVDDDGQISSEDLYKYVLNRMTGSGVEQRPQRWTSWLEADLVVASSLRRMTDRGGPVEPPLPKPATPSGEFNLVWPAAPTEPLRGPQARGRMNPAPAPGPVRAAGSGAASAGLDTGGVVDGRYQLLERLGGGALCDVFKALDRLAIEHQDPDPFVAVKILKPNSSAKAVLALQREVSRARRLTHSNILRVHHFDQDRVTGQHFLVMELLEGRSVESILKEARKGQPWTRIAPLIGQVSAALSHAHTQGIIHSGIKPSSVFITTSGGVKLLDFGLAAPMPSLSGRETILDARVWGTSAPPYTTLETYLGAEPHYSDDVYSLACLTYQWLTGRPPYTRGKEPAKPVPAPAALKLGLRAHPIGGLTREQNRALIQALALRRVERTQTMDEFWKSMTAVAPVRPVTAKTLLAATAAAAGVAVLALGVALVGLWHQPDRHAVPPAIHALAADSGLSESSPPRTISPSPPPAVASPPSQQPGKDENAAAAPEPSETNESAAAKPETAAEKKEEDLRVVRPAPGAGLHLVAHVVPVRLPAVAASRPPVAAAPVLASRTPGAQSRTPVAPTQAPTVTSEGEPGPGLQSLALPGAPSAAGQSASLPQTPPSAVERDYVGAVQRIIRSHSHIADAVEYRPALLKGREALVSFQLDRQGRVSQVFVDRPSGSVALDRLAVRIIASGMYPRFPQAAWPGKPAYVFSTTIALEGNR